MYLRYFLITFSIKDIASVGNILMESDGFPSRENIQKEVAFEYKKNYTVVVTNIFEFKSEDDYKDFIN